MPTRRVNTISIDIAHNQNQQPAADKNTDLQLKITTFNLFNYLQPPNAYYDFERIYSVEQWHKKQRWITAYLAQYQPDIIGFQEVFSIAALKQLVELSGYEYFAVVDQPKVTDDFIYSQPVVAIASRYPLIEVDDIKVNKALAQTLGLAADFAYSRKILRATIAVPHLGQCDCYVVHFKSKRSMIAVSDIDSKQSPEPYAIDQLTATIAGGWASTIQRGSEATLLMMEIIARREQTGQPMVLMGDFNNNLSDGVLSHLLTASTAFHNEAGVERLLAKYALYDAWDLYQQANLNEQDDINELPPAVRPATHYYAGGGSVLDYILLSAEFDASQQSSLYQVSAYATCEQHLINPIFDRDGSSTDHGVVMVTLTLRS